MSSIMMLNFSTSLHCLLCHISNKPILLPYQGHWWLKLLPTEIFMTHSLSLFLCLHPSSLNTLTKIVIPITNTSLTHFYFIFIITIHAVHLICPLLQPLHKEKCSR